MFKAPFEKTIIVTDRPFHLTAVDKIKVTRVGPVCLKIVYLKPAVWWHPTRCQYSGKLKNGEG